MAARPEFYRELAQRVAAKREAEGIVNTSSELSRERLWILPEIGDLAVASIKAEHIDGIYENARERGKSRTRLH